MKKVHLALIAAGAVLVAGVGYLVYAPYQTAKQVQSAVVAKDSAQLLNLVDVQAVEAHLQTHFRQQLQQDIANKNTQSELLLLGEAMGEVMVERLAGEYGNREAIVRTMLNGKPTKGDQPIQPASPSPIEQAEMGYQGLGQFHITVPSERPVQLVMTRDGLGWKVTQVNFTP